MAAERNIEFVITAPQATAVGLAGSFNEWDASRTPLKRSKNGAWKLKLPLVPGRHEYRFVVDGEWISDPAAAESVANPHGSTNSIIIVS